MEEAQIIEEEKETKPRKKVIQIPERAAGPAKKTRKRRHKERESFPIEKAFAALLKLDEVIGEFPFDSFRGGTKMSRDFMRARGKLFDELMSNARQPGALARIASIQAVQKPPTTFNQNSREEIIQTARVAQSKATFAQSRTVTPETLITEIKTLDAFISEQTPGRYFEPEFFGKKIRLLAVGPDEAEAVKGVVSAPDKVLEFKGEALKLLPPESVKDIFEGMIGYRGDVMVICLKPGSPLIQQ